MTQQVFANAIGTTPATLSGIFNDRTRPTINIIESIKKKFPDISLEWLMFGLGDMYQQAPTPSGEHVAPAEEGLFTPQTGQEQVLDFGSNISPTPQPTNFKPQMSHSAPSYNNSVRKREILSKKKGAYADKSVGYIENAYKETGCVC